MYIKSLCLLFENISKDFFFLTFKTLTLIPILIEIPNFNSRIKYIFVHLKC